MSDPRPRKSIYVGADEARLRKQRKERKEDMKTAMLRKPILRPKCGYSRIRVEELSQPKVMKK